MWLYKRTPLFLMTFKSSSKLRSSQCDNFNYFITSLYVQCAYTILNVERSEVSEVRKGGGQLVKNFTAHLPAVNTRSLARQHALCISSSILMTGSRKSSSNLLIRPEGTQQLANRMSWLGIILCGCLAAAFAADLQYTAFEQWGSHGPEAPLFYPGPIRGRLQS